MIPYAASDTDDAEAIVPWTNIGPGLITGASDDDPFGIGTYAVAGASLVAIWGR